MSARIKVLSSLAAMAAVFTAFVAEAAPAPRLMPADALIENTGSTNTSGYTIYVSPSGAVQFAKAGGLMPSPFHFDTATLPKAQVQTLFHDLGAAGSMSRLTVRHGMRSASFGTRTSIFYKGQQSPDLTFGGDEHANALKADIAQIIQTLHISNTPRRPILLPGTVGIPQRQK